jgi:exopolysaccharide biosynthesis protein
MVSFRIAKKLVCIFFITLKTAQVAHAYKYEVKKENNHVIHIVTLNQQEYKAEIAKANNCMFGRESLDSIANRLDAEIAINAGFFEIKNPATSLPSGTLIIERAIYGFQPGRHNVVKVDDSGNISIEKFKARIMLEFGREMLDITNINGVKSHKDEPILYTSSFGSRTLTDYHGRKEIAFDRSGQVEKVSNHGNASIPKGGFVVSFPREKSIDKVAKRSIRLHFQKPLNIAGNNSYVSGIPLLLYNGQIPEPVISQHSSYFTNAHARTAIGTTPDNSVIIVVAEHTYSRDIDSITLEEANSFIKNRQEEISNTYGKKINDLSFSEIKDVIKKGYSSDHETIGLTLPQLAQLMQEIGCDRAINLDGGGSSSLWIKDKIVNRTIGDDDESKGQNTLRAVSDAIVFRRK